MVDPLSLIKILTLTTLAFVVAVIWTPVLTHILYKYRLGKSIRSAVTAPMFAELHKKKAGVPTMGGVLIWITVLVLGVVFAAIAALFPESPIASLNFLTRSQTWLPLGALVAAGVVGLADDFMNVFKIGPQGGGVHFRIRLLLYAIIAAIGAWWFFVKLEWNTLAIPLYGDVSIGWLYIPFFILVIVGTSFSVNQTDGLDGLAGGTLASAFAAFAIIALMQGRYDLAAFCGVIVGALLAFLWFNIYPARFIMGDTGAMSMGVTLGIVAMLTNSALLLPIIGFVFVIETVTTFIQIFSKKVFGKKVFLIAPIHHHFEAKGWPEPKVVMRFWVISWIGAGLGLIVALLDLALRG
ncbi:phospho-N-acetylmuramoyl-pentapeptide-transferase [Patescibacteria group bacterium]|jgi:phospho-N-acetylmuramoyl-pentapeptide-transferase|nr:phospho-N-acetylmuramoyl-pentapeptide-transferase [Patescibacteria group bacterium]